MPIEPFGDERFEHAQPGIEASKSRPPLERSRFGGTQRRQERPVDDAPVSRSDLSKGSQKLLEDRKVRINWSVLLISSVVILAFSVWAILMPDGARTSVKTTVDWIATNLGWYYVLTMALMIGFVLWVALSKEGDVRLGPDHSRPQYKLATWAAMLFAAGVGIDLLFFSVTGPVVQYLHRMRSINRVPCAIGAGVR
jgi:choline/glycine/proline betaine transport protein